MGRIEREPADPRSGCRGRTAGDLQCISSSGAIVPARICASSPASPTASTPHYCRCGKTRSATAVGGGSMAGRSSLTRTSPRLFRAVPRRSAGWRVIPKALLGVCRTCAADYIGSTLQVCYAGEVPYANVKHSFADSGHTDSRLFELSELDGIPEEQQHWYPMWAGRAGPRNPDLTHRKKP